MSKKIIESYPDDIEDCLEDELIQFLNILENPLYSSKINRDNDAKMSVELQYYILINENGFKPVFPNIEIALRIYLSMMVTNCSGERSFSKLLLIKNRLRSSLVQEKLNHLTMMSIENEIMRNMDTSSLINDFAQMKARKKKLA